MVEKSRNIRPHVLNIKGDYQIQSNQDGMERANTSGIGTIYHIQIGWSGITVCGGGRGEICHAAGMTAGINPVLSEIDGENEMEYTEHRLQSSQRYAKAWLLSTLQ